MYDWTLNLFVSSNKNLKAASHEVYLLVEKLRHTLRNVVIQRPLDRVQANRNF